MPTSYTYDLWNGKEVIGTISFFSRLIGKSVFIPEVSIFKQLYGRKVQGIEVPISYIVVKDDGIEYTVRAVLDIRRKSKRQIEFLKTVGTI